jgi:hypothetical protein
MFRNGSVLTRLYSIQTSLMSRLTALGTTDPDPWVLGKALMAFIPAKSCQVIRESPSLRRRSLAAAERFMARFIGDPSPINQATFYYRSGAAGLA